MIPRTRHGVALLLVLVVCLLGFGSFLVVFQMMQHGRTQREHVDSRARAIFIAEAGFNRMLAKLLARGWSNRWFRDAPAIEEDVAYAGGTYSSLVTVSDEARRAVDILISGTFERSTVRMVWRIRYEDSSFTLFPRISVEVFDYLQDDPGPGGFQPGNISHEIQQILQDRARHAGVTDGLVTSIRAEPGLARVLQSLGRPDGDAVLQLAGIPAMGAAPAGARIGPVSPLPTPGPGNGAMPVPSEMPARGPLVAPGTWWPQDPSSPWSLQPGSRRPSASLLSGLAPLLRPVTSLVPITAPVVFPLVPEAVATPVF